MPLTFAHPAAVIPLKRRWPHLFCWSGLIIGSMAPDIEYFVRLRPFARFSHTWWGVLVEDLPLALMAAWLTQRVVREPLLDALPARMRDWLNSFDGGDFFPNSWVAMRMFILSCIVGAYTHVVWDSFTHRGGWFVKCLPVLRIPLEMGSWQPPVFKMLQYIFSVLGLALIFLLLWRSYRQFHTAAEQKTNQRKLPQFAAMPASAFSRNQAVQYWVIVLLLSVCLWWFFLPASGIRMNPKTWATYIVCMTDGFMAGLLTASLWWRLTGKI